MRCDPPAGGSADAEEIREFCQGQIAHFKVPQHVRVVEALPVTVTGKLQKYLIRERVQAELGLAPPETAQEGTRSFMTCDGCEHLGRSIAMRHVTVAPLPPTPG